MFATDAILATLMCCTRSVNSWDIIVQRVGNKLFFDKRDNSDFGKFEAPEHNWLFVSTRPVQSGNVSTVQFVKLFSSNTLACRSEDAVAPPFLSSCV